ncbi:MAG: endonuclease III [Clostridia bacterium]|jgi:endonuclease-3|nr:endonuclease III [Clostridia bacterium]MBQ1554499.1 endonuclease III [Clostridia bacterium]
MSPKELAARTVAALKEIYPDAICSLTYTNPLQLLIAVRLSAQCTDARVNQVTPMLFEKYSTLDDLCNADAEDIGEIIKPCGLFNTKARDIRQLAIMLRDQYGGTVPDSMEELLKLPGVGRKTANLILGDVYGQPAIVADTHCIRIAGRIGLTDGTKDPVKVEKQLRSCVDPNEGSDLCHRFVLFGRDICTARSPKCGNCPLNGFCRYAHENAL